MSNKLETYVENFCHSNLTVASYWLQETQDNLIDYMGMENKELPSHIIVKIQDLTHGLYSTASEVKALEEIVMDMQAKLERGVNSAIGFLDSFNIKSNKKEK